MEQGIIAAFGSLGTAGIGFLFAYMLLKNQLKSSSDISVAVDKLCAKIEILVESNFQLQQDNTVSADKANLAYSETKEHYAKISYKIDGVEDKIDKVSETVVRIFDKQGSSVQLGSILLGRGYISKEQLEEALLEQKEYRK